jgi:hypothetical protein
LDVNKLQSFIYIKAHLYILELGSTNDCWENIGHNAWYTTNCART